jgi:HSP20 family protein
MMMRHENPYGVAPHQRRRRNDIIPYRAPIFPSLIDDDPLEDWLMNPFEAENRLMGFDNNLNNKALPSRLNLDIKNNDANFEIIADVPGVDKNNVHVDVKDNLMTISAERKVAKDDKGENFTRIERQSGFVSRSFTLPDNVKTDNISADLINGELHVIVPKLELETKKSNQFKVPVKSTPSG